MCDHSWHQVVTDSSSSDSSSTTIEELIATLVAVILHLDLELSAANFSLEAYRAVSSSPVDPNVRDSSSD